jgi:hypothetical protein
VPQLGSLLDATNRAVDSAPRSSSVPNAAPVQTPQRAPLVWDAEVKEYHAQPGETNIQFTFTATNTGPTEVVINEVRTSCGCVVATLPEYPWRLAPGTNGQVQVIADLRGQRGLLHKMVYVHIAEHGIQSLAIKVHMPDSFIEQPRRQDAKLIRSRPQARHQTRIILSFAPRWHEQSRCANCVFDPIADPRPRISVTQQIGRPARGPVYRRT